MNFIVPLLVFVVCCFILLVFYSTQTGTILYAVNVNTDNININDTKYLVGSPKCKILNIDPFDSQVMKYHELHEYLACSKHELLTYVFKNDTTTSLCVNPKAVRFYSPSHISCCVSKIIRLEHNKKPDDFFKLSVCKEFEHCVQIEDFSQVTCYKDPNHKTLVYQNVHAPIVIGKNLQNKLDVFRNQDAVYSVLIIGIDSISRLNFIRSLSSTHKFLEENNWISLKGYNKIGDNTFPNVMGLLTGYNKSYAYKKCKPLQPGGFDGCPFIWNEYKRHGYVTAIGEDETSLNTFNFYKKGFKQPPTHYYFRSYFLAAEKLNVKKIKDLAYCTGPETSGERVLHLAKDFATSFVKYPSFGFFWMNTFSHNDMNTPSRMDDKIKQFFQDISNNGVLEKSFVVFLSDHGSRFGEFRKTAMGWLEERLPFIYLWVPHRFRRLFPAQYSNIVRNINKITTPYDVYMTLQDVLVLSDFNHKMQPSNACLKCKSLFSDIEDRSCEDSGVAPQWCTCTDFSPIDQNNTIVSGAAAYILDQINIKLKKSNAEHLCVSLKLHQVIAASVSNGYGHNKYVLVVLETKPKALFETMVQYQEKSKEKFLITSDISRIDRYEKHSYCVRNHDLLKFCHCK